MSWRQRLRSVAEELRGRGASELRSETGIGARTWRAYVYRFVDELADSFALGPFSLDVVRHFALGSAIYEWAAINTGERFTDRLAFHTSYNDVLARPSPSVGAFQGYAGNAAWALANDESLRTLVRRDRYMRTRDWARMDWTDMAQPLVGNRIPGPDGREEPRRWPIRDSDPEGAAWSIASDSFFSLIGKVRNSLRCAQDVASVMHESEFNREAALPPQMRSPGAGSGPQSSDPICVWLLALYEFTDQQHEEVRKNLRRIVDAVANPGSVRSFRTMADIERPRLTYRALGIAAAEHFSYDAARRMLMPQFEAGHAAPAR